MKEELNKDWFDSKIALTASFLFACFAISLFLILSYKILF